VLTVWGLSATIGNLAGAKDALLGKKAAEGVIVSGRQPKAIEIETLIPGEMERFPWAGHLGIRMLPQVIERIDSADSTLLFTNTRSQAEIWYQSILAERPDWKDQLGLHHGSLERERRAEVEGGIASGRLKCVVCTSSLDLGVDFSPVEQVLQVGSPKGVARLIQRAGRSGHQPGAVSRVIGVPTNALELIEFAAARDAIRERRIENREPLRRPLDVLAQHLVTVAIGVGFRVEEMRREVARTHAYRDLSEAEWAWVLDFITFGGKTLQAYPDFRKVVEEDGLFRVTDRRVIQLHRMNIGTIASESAVSVRFANGKRLGTVEEGFISRFKKGDQFVFAGKRLELVRLRDLTATVTVAKRR
jgi:ATP-dependent Lhr-like helicase